MALLIMQTTPVSAVELAISDPEVKGLEITLSASLSGSTNYYLQGALRAQNSSKYFCETKNNLGNWIDYLSNPDKEYIASNFFRTDIQESSWSGKLSLRYKPDDPNYVGPGLYDLKLRRYTGNSTSSAGDSNTLTITLTEPLPTIAPTHSPASPTPGSTQVPVATPTPVSLPSPPPTVLPTPKFSPSVVATIAGATTEIDLTSFASTPTPTNQLEYIPPQTEPSLRLDRLKKVILIGGGSLLLLVSSYFAYRKYLNQRKAGS